MRLHRKKKKAFKKSVYKDFIVKVIKSKITFEVNEKGEEGFWITPLKTKEHETA